MTIPIKNIFEDTNKTTEIKGIRKDFSELRQNLKQMFDSPDAPIPREEADEDFLSIYDLYLRIESSETPLEKFNSLEKLEGLLEAFKLKYQEFISDEFVEGLEDIKLWTRISKGLIQATSYAMAASFEENETKQLGLLYSGIILYQEIIENYLVFFTETGIQIAKSQAEKAINFQPLNNYASKKPFDEIVNYAKGIRNAAKSILWEVERHEKAIQLQELSQAQSLKHKGRNKEEQIEKNKPLMRFLESRLREIEIIQTERD